MNNYFAFIDESGVLDESKNIQPYFAVGFLKIADTRYQDTAWEFPFHFCALIIDKTDPLFNSSIYKNYWRAYIKYAKLLCEKNCANEENLCVVADYMNKPRGETMYFERELNSLSNIFNTLRAHSETFTLLQICDLILGSVVFQWRQKNGFVGDSNRARAKKELVDHLVGKLVIPSNKKSEYPLAQDITINKPFYFSVWPLRLSKIK